MTSALLSWDDLLEDCKICVLRACTPFSRLFFFLTSNASNRLRLAPALASLSRAYFNPALVRHACEEGHVSIVEWLIQHHIPITASEYDAAVLGGHLPLVKLLLNSTSEVQLSNAPRLASLAARGGQWAVADLIFEVRGPFRADELFWDALRDQQSAWIERALAPCHASSVLMSAAAKAGDLPLLQRIYAFPTFELNGSKAAFVGAVEGAQLATLEWVLSETSVGKLKPQELAGLLGRWQWYPLCGKPGALPVLRFLRDRKVPFPNELPEYCAAGGNVEAFQWLISRPIRGKKPLAPILDLLVHEAGYFGHQLILDLLEAESRRPLDLQRVLEAAAEGGQVALLRSTLEKLPGEPSGELVASLLKLALVKGQNDSAAFAFLLERYGSIARTHGEIVAQSAARTATSTPLRLLHFHGWDLRSVPGLVRIASRSSDSLQFLLEIGCRLDKSEAVELAHTLSKIYQANNYRLLLQAGQIEFDPSHLDDLAQENAFVPLAGYLKREKLVNHWKAVRDSQLCYLPWFSYWLEYCNHD